MALGLLDLIIPTAQAAPAGGAHSQGDPLSTILFFGGLIVIMYFVLIRPQNKRAKEHRDLLSNLAKDDEVVTTGGLVGRITELGEQYTQIEIADNITVRIQKSAVSLVLPKGTLKTI
jgi:preprotein translocase subunit YajC